MNSYFITTNNMVDPSRVQCKKCGSLASNRTGNWYVNNSKEGFMTDENYMDTDNLCPDCVAELLGAFFLNQQKTDETILYNVLQWIEDEQGESAQVIDVMECVSDYHAKALLKQRITNGRYPKGAYLECKENWRAVE
jgi:hypothetical protein